MKKLLGVFAHPDDESVAAGGTIAKYAKTGWTADLVTVTRGEAGPWGRVDAEGRALPDVRTGELESACSLLGVRSVTFLDYRDGHLSDLHPGELEDAIGKIVAGEKPDVVITHDPTGTTNHPDHSKVSYAATYAFQEYAGLRNEEKPDDPNPPKLYYSCFPQTVMSYLVRERLFPSEMHGKPVVGTEDKKITTVIDISRFASLKRKALMAHATQEEILAKYLAGPSRISPFLRQEYFRLRYIGRNEAFLGKNDRISDRL